MKPAVQHTVIWAREAHSSALVATLGGRIVTVRNRDEFLAACGMPGAVAFADLELLAQLAPEQPYVPVVGIIENALADMVESLEQFPWLSQLIAGAILATPIARPYLTMLLEELECWPDQRIGGVGVGVGGIGRVALVASSTRRAARFDRMSDFLSQHGLSGRTITMINDAAEELVANALYDAPLEAGYFKQAVSRTEDVNLPPNCACEISYGIENANVFLRVRDPFGALSRARLIDVLKRCTKAAIALDESRGGAGLGIWRVFSVASTVSVTVVPGKITDFLVGFATKDGGGNRADGKRLLAVHLAFNSNRDDRVLDDDALDQSVAILR